MSPAALVRKLAVTGALVPAAMLALHALPASAAPFGGHRSGFGYGNRVNARQGNQQSRISQGVRDGQIAPGGAQRLENREDGIHNAAAADRAANGGRLTAAERSRLNARQNDVSRSIYADKHNGYNDESAALRNGTTYRQERRDARQIDRQDRPQGPESR